jgi:hypothetical protein
VGILRPRAYEPAGAEVTRDWIHRRSGGKLLAKQLTC